MEINRKQDLNDNLLKHAHHKQAGGSLTRRLLSRNPNSARRRRTGNNQQGNRLGMGRAPLFHRRFPLPRMPFQRMESQSQSMITPTQRSKETIKEAQSDYQANPTPTESFPKVKSEEIRKASISSKTNILSIPSSVIHKERSTKSGKNVPEDLGEFTPKKDQKKFQAASPGLNIVIHPLDSLNSASQLTFGWISKMIKIQAKLIRMRGYTAEESQYTLPGYDNVFIGYQILGQFFWRQRYEKQRNLASAIANTFQWGVIQLAFGILISIAMDFLKVFLLVEILRKIEAPENGGGSGGGGDSEGSLAYLGWHCLGMVGLQVLSELLSNLVEFEACRQALRLKSGLRMMLLNKVFKLNCQNRQKYSKGDFKILSEKKCKSLSGYFEDYLVLTRITIELILTLIFSILIFGWGVILMVSATLVASVLLAVTNQASRRLKRRLLLSGFFKKRFFLNIIKFTKSIKSSALETFYHYKIHKESQKEVEALNRQSILLGFKRSALLVFSWTPLATVALLKTYLEPELPAFYLLVGFICLYRVIERGLKKLPKLNKSMDTKEKDLLQIEEFLNSEEQDRDWVRQDGVKFLDDSALSSTGRMMVPGVFKPPVKFKEADMDAFGGLGGGELEYSFFMKNGCFEWKTNQNSGIKMSDLELLRKSLEPSKKGVGAGRGFWQKSKDEGVSFVGLNSGKKSKGKRGRGGRRKRRRSFKSTTTRSLDAKSLLTVKSKSSFNTSANVEDLGWGEGTPRVGNIIESENDNLGGGRAFEDIPGHNMLLSDRNDFRLRTMTHNEIQGTRKGPSLMNQNFQNPDKIEQAGVVNHQNQAAGRPEPKGEQIKQQGANLNIYPKTLPKYNSRSPTELRTLQDTHQKSAKGRSSSFLLQDLNIMIQKGKLVFIIGKENSGKSSLLLSILGELKPKSPQKRSPRAPKSHSNPKKLKKDGARNPEIEDSETKLYIDGSVSYLPEKPWIMPGSILENIVLEKAYDSQRFRKCVRVSQMDFDLELMPRGIDTVIGTDLLQLEDKQRTRIGLARTVYQDSDIILLDDPLTALDHGFADSFVKYCLCGDLKFKTRVITTSSLSHLSYADEILLVEDGRIRFKGAFQDLKKDPVYEDLVRHDKNRKLGHPAPHYSSKPGDKGNYDQMGWTQGIISKYTQGAYSLEEEDFRGLEMFLGVEKHRIQYPGSILTTSIQLMGGLPNIVILTILSTVSQLTTLIIVYDYLLWAQVGLIKPLDTQEYSSLLKIGFWTLASKITLEAICTTLSHKMTTKLLAKLQNMISFRILHSSISKLLNIIPYQMILSLYSQATESISGELGELIHSLFTEISLNLISIVAIIFTTDNPYLVLPFTANYLLGIREFQRCSIYRLEVDAQAEKAQKEMNSLLASSVAGTTEIRVMMAQRHIKRLLAQNLNQSVYQLLLRFGFKGRIITRVLAFNAVLVQAPTLFYIFYFIWRKGHGINELNLAVCVFFLFILAKSALRLTRTCLELESLAIRSIKACLLFEEIEPELDYKEFNEERILMQDCTMKGGVSRLLGARSGDARDMLFRRGKVEIIDLYARYCQNSENVLTGLNLKIQPGEKIAVIGKPGSGKSSLLRLFERFLEPYKGEILIDGKFVQEQDLKLLRGEISTIPQAPMLIEGSIRENIDPRLEHVDNRKNNPSVFFEKEMKILRLMEDLGFDLGRLSEQGLDFNVGFEGKNLTFQEKQIVSITRGIMKQSRLYLIDEAINSLDVKAEDRLMKQIRTRLQFSTVLVCTRRIYSAMQCDKIVVLEEGRVVEFDRPRVLLENSESHFIKIFDRYLSDGK